MSNLSSNNTENSKVNKFYLENLIFFKATNNSIYKDLLHYESDFAEIKKHNNKTNLWLNDIPFYSTSFEETFNSHKNNIRRYITDFIKVPFNFNTDYSKSVTESEISLIAVKKSVELAKKGNLTPISDESLICGGLLIILGLGTGQQIVEMVQKLKPNRLIIFENQYFILQATMKHFSWSKLDEKLKKLGCSFRVFISNNNNPAVAVYSFIENISAEDKHYVHLISIYLHSTSLFFKSCLNHLKNSLIAFYTVEGFLEDEIKMIQNISSNINHSGKKIILKAKRLSKNCPALLVGSGPSVENNYKLISKLKNSMVLFSCGTALGGLLKNGITPDFHCELENGVQIADHFEELQKNYNLQNIPLICSYTVSPAISIYFNKINYFVRPGPYLAFAFAGKATSLVGSEPSVLNTALSLSIHFGFETSYIFGGDHGSLDNKSHHAKSIIFYKDKNIAKKHKSLLKATEYNRKYNIETKANFGGTSYTNSNMQQAGVCINMLIYQARECTVYNCSDGCYIEGTIPCLPGTIKINTVSKLEKASDVNFVSNCSKDINILKEDCKNYIRKLTNFSNLFEKSQLEFIDKNLSISKNNIDISNFLKEFWNHHYGKNIFNISECHSIDEKLEIIIHKIWQPTFSDVIYNIYFLLNCFKINNFNDFKSEMKSLLKEIVILMGEKVRKIELN